MHTLPAAFPPLAASSGLSSAAAWFMVPAARSTSGTKASFLFTDDVHAAAQPLLPDGLRGNALVDGALHQPLDLPGHALLKALRNLIQQLHDGTPPVIAGRFRFWMNRL